MEPRRPRNFPHHAERCLDALAGAALGHQISVGGAFGLLHYLDYRSTRDVDAWWQSTASPRDRRRVVEVLETALGEVGEVRTREWGEVVSVELLEAGRKTFSFQIAERSVQLGTSEPAPWGDVLLDGFDDLVASKMVALVERGAPRDFRDVRAVCRSGLITADRCWLLWRRRQERAGVSPDPGRAKLAVETHLARSVTWRRRHAAGTRRSCSMPSWIDGTLYPDTEIPDRLETVADRVDVLARLCASWDFGVLPEAETVAEIRRPDWRAAVEACQLLTSPTYHLVREWHDLAPAPYLGQEIPEIRDDPSLAFV